MILYELVSGHLPIDGGDAIQTLLMQASKKPRKPSMLVPDLHPELDRIIMQLLEKAPDDRLQSASELFGLLEAIKDELSIEEPSTHLGGPLPDEVAAMLPAPPPSSDAFEETLRRPLPEADTARTVPRHQFEAFEEEDQIPTLHFEDDEGPTLLRPQRADEVVTGKMERKRNESLTQIYSEPPTNRRLEAKEPLIPPDSQMTVRMDPAELRRELDVPDDDIPDMRPYNQRTVVLALVALTITAGLMTAAYYW